MKYLNFILISLLVLGSCREPEQQAGKKGDIINVRVQHPEYMEYIEPVRSSGMLTTRTEMKLSFKTGGIVQVLNVREGQIVEQGFEIASLDLSEIKSQVHLAGIAYDKARRDYRRANNLYKDSVATLETVQNAKSAYDLAKAQKKIADFNLEYSRILAPTKGRIQKLLVEKNEMIAPGYPALLFASTENDWIVRVSLSDKDIVKFSSGDSAIIEMDAFPDKKYPAVVSELGSFADPVTGTYEVDLLLNETNPEFRTGFIARVNLYPDDSTSGLWLPFESLHNLDGNNGFVFILDSIKVEKREVKTGKIKDGGILILNGLSQDDLVVTEGASLLKESSIVKVLQ